MINFLIENGHADNVEVNPAQRAPAGFGDLVNSSWDNASYNLRYTSQMKAQRETLFNAIDPILDDLADRDASFKPNEQAQQAQKFYTLEKSPALGGRFARTFEEASYAAWSALVAERGLDNPFPTWADVESASRELAIGKRERFNEDMANAGTTSPRMAAFLGESGSIMTSPVGLMALAASAPVAIVARPLAALGMEAAISGGYEIATQPQIQSWLQSQGETYEDKDVLAAIMFGWLAGGVIGGGISSVYKRFGGVNRGFMVGPTGDVARILNGLEAQADAFGVPAYRVMGPPREGEQLEPERWKFTGPIDRRVEQPTQTGIVVENNGAGFRVNYTEDHYAGAWAPSNSLSTMIYGATEDIPLPQRPIAMTRAMDYHLYATGPYRAQPTSATAYDSVLYNMDKIKLDKAHTDAIFDAVEALHEGRLIDPANKDSLSIGLRIGDTPEHLTTVRRMLDEGVPVSLKSKHYRQYLHGVITGWMQGRLNRIVEGVELPEDGKFITTTVQPPRGTMDKISERAAKQMEVSRELNDEIKAIDKANLDMQSQANRLDPEHPDYEKNRKWLLNQAKKNHRTKAERQARLAKLNAELENVPAEMKAYADAKDAYDADVAHVTRVNAALAAKEDLAELMAGNMPARLRPLRAELDTTYQGLMKTAAPPEWEDAAERLIKLNGFDARNGGRTFDVNTTTNPYLQASKERIYSIAETRKLNEAREAEMERLDPNMTFNLDDGTTITVKQQLDEFKIIDDVLNGMGVCGIGGKGK